MKRIKVKCEKCGKEISKSNYLKHFNSCDGIKRENFKKLEICPYCKKDLSHIRGGNHTRWCKQNDNSYSYDEKRIKKIKADLEKARNCVTIETRKIINTKIKEAWKNGAYINIKHDSFKGKHHSTLSKNKISEGQKRWILENPEKHLWNISKNKSVPCEYLKKRLKEAGIEFKEEFQPLLPERFFSVDIAFPEKKLAIEVNGNQHYNENGALQEYYQNRHELIENSDWQILELHYKEVYKDDIIEEILVKLREAGP